MIERLIHNKLFKPKKLVGISCEIISENSFRWRYCILQQNSSNIAILKCDTLSDLGDLKNEKLSLVPIYLTIDGKGIINKKIKTDTGHSPILDIIPNATIDDFYYSKTDAVDDYSLISMMRVDAIDSILRQFEDLNLQVINIQIGSFHVASLYNRFDGLPDSIVTSAITINIDSKTHKPTEFHKTELLVEEKYLFAGEEISSLFISPFAAALGFFFEEDNPVYQAVQKNRTNFLAQRLFIICGWGILIVAFLTLLINYLFYMHYADKINLLDVSITKNGQNLIVLEKLQDEMKRKDAFVAQSGFSEKSSFAYFTDQIASTIPININLYELTTNPLVSKVKKEKAVEVRKNSITVKGQTPNSIILNDWIKVLEDFKWINKISVMHYAKAQNDRFGEFMLEIEMLAN